MNTNKKLKHIINEAKKKNAKIKEGKKSKSFLISLQWLGYLGLIRTNICKPKKTIISLNDLLKAGKYEPRVYELLPAIVYRMSFIFDLKNEKIPNDIKIIIKKFESGEKLPDFRGIKPRNYKRWINSSSIELAIARIKNPPRNKTSKNQINSIGKTIKDERVKLGYTQTHLASKYNLSLRAIRDIEQNLENTSLKRFKQVLSALDLELNISPKILS